MSEKEWKKKVDRKRVTCSNYYERRVGRTNFAHPILHSMPETGIARVPMSAFTLNSLQARETLEATYLRLAMNRVNPVASARTRLYLRRVSFQQSPAKIDSRPSPYLEASCTRVRTRRNLFTSLPRPFEAAIARSCVPETKLSVGVIGDRTSEYYFLYRLVIIPTMFNDRRTGFRFPLPLNFNFDLFDRNNPIENCPKRSFGQNLSPACRPTT